MSRAHRTFRDPNAIWDAGVRAILVRAILIAAVASMFGVPRLAQAQYAAARMVDVPGASGMTGELLHFELPDSTGPLVTWIPLGQPGDGRKRPGLGRFLVIGAIAGGAVGYAITPTRIRGDVSGPDNWLYVFGVGSGMLAGGLVGGLLFWMQESASKRPQSYGN